MFSKTCKYGIRAVLFLAARSQEKSRFNLKEISAEIGSPEAFTGKILQNLNRNGIVKSTKGNSGGFFVDQKQLEEIRLVEIVNALDGAESYNSCLIGLSHCSDTHPCHVHHLYKPIKQEFLRMLHSVRIGELVGTRDETKVYFQILESIHAN